MSQIKRALKAPSRDGLEEKEERREGEGDGWLGVTLKIDLG